MKKIINIKTLLTRLKNFRKKNFKIIMCHGVFDILHSGHILHFQEAKSQGDILIVSVTADQFIRKGPNRPFFNTEQRMKMISELEIVDFVVESNELSAIKNLSILQPNIYCKGIDYRNHELDLTGKIIKEKNTLKKFNGRIFYTKSQKFSSSNLLNNYFDYLDINQKKYISRIKYLVEEDIRSLFKKVENLRVLVVGELIIDKYVFGEAVGKSSKDPVIVLNEGESLSYLGGSASIAKNISSVSKYVTLLTLNEKNSKDNNFIKREINNSFKVKYFTKKNYRTIVKKRFVEDINKRKLLGLYNLNDDIIDKENEKKVINSSVTK